jgi:hypothetical protein
VHGGGWAGAVDGADVQGHGGRRLHTMNVGPVAHWFGCGRFGWCCNALRSGATASSMTGSCCRRLRVAHLPPHLEPKLRARPTYVLVEPAGVSIGQARAAADRSQSARVRSPMAVTRAFGHLRVNMDLSVWTWCSAPPGPWPWLVEVQILPGPWAFGLGICNLFDVRIVAQVRIHPSCHARSHAHVHILTAAFDSRSCAGRRRAAAWATGTA